MVHHLAGLLDCVFGWDYLALTFGRELGWRHTGGDKAVIGFVCWLIGRVSITTYRFPRKGSGAGLHRGFFMSIQIITGNLGRSAVEGLTVRGVGSRRHRG
jgi:hypothetical protein